MGTKNGLSVPHARGDAVKDKPSRRTPHTTGQSPSLPHHAALGVWGRGTLPHAVETPLRKSIKIMASSTLSILLLLISISTSTSLGPGDQSSSFLLPHNRARAAVGVAPLAWNATIATLADRLARYQRDNKGCQFAGRQSMPSIKYGMNQVWGSGGAVPPHYAVESWVAEGKYYNYGNNSCASGHNCGVYKQVVWRESHEVGCAQGVCAKQGAVLTICLYYPPGNYVGERPY
ncbi:hypothetical protein Sjap_016823 [Stephania japonica]|uniref:SCP domain-containing protein n=1 Tax=Stephania japonica TaxID=461633 RepID=A0AAP0I508_9MAGN